VPKASADQGKNTGTVRRRGEDSFQNVPSFKGLREEAESTRQVVVSINQRRSYAGPKEAGREWVQGPALDSAKKNSRLTPEKSPGPPSPPRGMRCWGWKDR